MRKYNLLLTITLIFVSCNKGIEPEPEKQQNVTGFGGKVTFIGTWPPGVTRTHLVVFKDSLNSVLRFNPFNIAFISDSIPIGTSEYSYSSITNKLSDIFEITPGTYYYVCVAQSTDPELTLARDAWYVVGLYKTPGDSGDYSPLIITENNFKSDVNIICDYNNPPPQPPGGI